jgi:hypothetical protein
VRYCQFFGQFSSGGYEGRGNWQSNEQPIEGQFYNFLGCGIAMLGGFDHQFRRRLSVVLLEVRQSRLCIITHSESSGRVFGSKYV